jgi:hypothetical protein
MVGVGGVGGVGGVVEGGVSGVWYSNRFRSVERDTM